ncbi:hypothetical protein AUK22_10580 [bacterium CG2_30_54_10]|nr:MAG: hypothetical protein AUK22_10580 [bacterium CG2_30_54_10]
MVLRPPSLKNTASTLQAILSAAKNQIETIPSKKMLSRETGLPKESMILKADQKRSPENSKTVSMQNLTAPSAMILLRATMSEHSLIHQRFHTCSDVALPEIRQH